VGGLANVVQGCGTTAVASSGSCLALCPELWSYSSLADSGGTNDPRRRAWIYGLQIKLCNACGLTVTVAHYPPGASKWNPADHRLFSEISKNWAGRPLDSHETILNYITTTTTETGLRVHAHLSKIIYATGLKIPDEDWVAVDMRRLDPQPTCNYTLIPSFEATPYSFTNPSGDENSWLMVALKDEKCSVSI
jgi:hypothetical protein